MKIAERVQINKPSWKASAGPGSESRRSARILKHGRGTPPGRHSWAVNADGLCPHFTALRCPLFADGDVRRPVACGQALATTRSRRRLPRRSVGSPVSRPPSSAFVAHSRGLRPEESVAYAPRLISHLSPRLFSFLERLPTAESGHSSMESLQVSRSKEIQHMHWRTGPIESLACQVKSGLASKLLNHTLME